MEHFGDKPYCSGLSRLLTAGRVLSMMATMTDNSPLMFSESLCARLAVGPVYCLGRAGMDLYPEPAGVITEDAEQFRADMGGSAANIAVALSRQRGRAALLTVFSDDQVGRFVIRKCADYGVDTNSCRTQSGLCRNSLAIAETKPADVAVVIYRNHAADLELTSEDVSLVDFSAAGGLVVTGTALSGEPSASAVSAAISAAKQAGCPVIIDIDYRANAWETAGDAARRMSPELTRADILVGNNHEFSLLCGGDEDKSLEAACKFAASGQMVLYKMGDRGCRTIYQGREIKTGIFPVVLAKPFGAGDAFLGNVLARLGRDADIRAAVIQGSAAAAFVVARPGCASAMPDKEQLSQFMAQNQMRPFDGQTRG